MFHSNKRMNTCIDTENYANKVGKHSVDVTKTGKHEARTARITDGATTPRASQLTT